MKVVFICGSVEPARDGVGDYLRRLSMELLERGHQVSLIAINDPYVAADCLEPQDTVDTTFTVLRFPVLHNQSLEMYLLKAWMAKFDPDLISLHYVPFAFHPKGLSLALCKKLQLIGEGRRWHVMFHELWLGMEQRASFKFKLWGLTQKWLIKKLLSTLKPKLISTQTQLYQAQLKKIGYKAAIFPLFSNIAVSRYQPAPLKPIGELNFVVFGTISKNAPFEAFTAEAFAYANEQRLVMNMTFIGRCGKEMENWIHTWSQAGLKFTVLGEQPEEMVSDTLRMANYGISSTPFLLVEKSGSVAAMRAHGLPVICVAEAWIPEGIRIAGQPAGVMEYRPGLFNFCMEHRLPAAPVFHLAEAASQLLQHTWRV